MVAQAGLTPAREASRETVSDDLQRILQTAGLPQGVLRLGDVILRPENAQSPGNTPTNEVSFRCGPGSRGEPEVRLDIRATPFEWVSTAYYGLQKLGFLFPHPKLQVSPARQQVFSLCGRTLAWKPRFPIRGFHLHTQHPNEWMFAFLEGKSAAAADDTIRWLARNMQNAVQVVLLRPSVLQGPSRRKIALPMRAPYELARRLGILRGLSVSFNELQQRSLRLVSPVSLADPGEQIRRSIRQLNASYDYDYLTCDLGGTEFTPSDETRTLAWIETARAELSRSGKGLLTKIHVSQPSEDPSANFNLLTEKAAPEVGVQVHTVMYYGLQDAVAPVYGRRNFSDLASFLSRESARRPTWYFPETSYWVGMDVDVPIFLTDYLRARSNDMDWVEKQGVQGHVTFTSGQEFGYWLPDWTVALLSNAEHAGQPLIGLELLGESPTVWQPILDFQTSYVKNAGLLPMLSSENLMDVVSSVVPALKLRVHQRKTLHELSKDSASLRNEIGKLQEAVDHLPSLEGVRNRELRLALEVTAKRVRHALLLRQAMAASSRKGSAALLRQAAEVRVSASTSVAEMAAMTRYPELPLFDRVPNLTSYPYGYLWPASTLRFWTDEEKRVGSRRYLAPDFQLADPMRVLNPL